MTQAGDDYRDSVAAALAEDGKGMVLTSKTAGTYDAATGTAPETTNAVPCFGVITTFNRRDIGDGSRIAATDKMIILQGLDLDVSPKQGDIIDDGYNQWEVKNVEVLDVDDQPFAYILQGR